MLSLSQYLVTLNTYSNSANDRVCNIPDTIRRANPVVLTAVSKCILYFACKRQKDIRLKQRSPDTVWKTKFAL